jgi:hypothetical protein
LEYLKRIRGGCNLWLCFIIAPPAMLTALIAYGNLTSWYPISAKTTKPTIGQDVYGRLPLSFEENRGRTDARVKFLARGAGYSVFLTPTEAVLKLNAS